MFTETDELSLCQAEDSYICPRKKAWEAMLEKESRLITTLSELAEVTAALDMALEQIPDLNQTAQGDIPVLQILWGCSSHLHGIVTRETE